MRILQYNDGFISNGLFPGQSKAGKIVAKRGAIKGFSGKSSKRLRDFLVKYTVPGARRVAITCTLPCKVSVQDWYGIMKRFRQNVIRSGLAAVWRVELQRRGVPHLHLVGYSSSGIDGVGSYWSSWVNACDSVVERDDLSVCAHEGFLVYGFCARWVDGSRWIAYLAAHCVKHKNEQLGWQGRQWGVFNRAMFREIPPLDFEMSDWVAVRVARVIRRRYRYRGFCKDSFGSRVFFGLQCLPDVVEYYRGLEHGIDSI